MKWIWIIAMGLCLFLFEGCQHPTGEPHSKMASDLKGAQLAKAETPVERRQLTFPKEFAGIPFERVKVYEKDMPGYGVSYLYGNETTQIDVSVFDAGFDEIKDGVVSLRVHQLFEQSKAEIIELENEGYFTLLKVLADDVLNISDLEFLFFNCVLQDQQQTKTSCLMLSHYDGNFIKVRFTTDQSLAESAFDQFIIEFGILFEPQPAS